MSNYSGVYELYLQGYAGFEAGVVVGEGYPKTERLAQALALGVHHRVTSKPPLMSSVAVTAELRKLSKAETKTKYDVRLMSIGADVIGAIKVVRELTNYSLKDAKDLVERVRGTYREQFSDDSTSPPAQPQTVLVAVDQERAWAASARFGLVGCVVEVS